METIDIASLHLAKNAIVIDIGCGEGRHTLASQLHFPDATVIGLDLDVKSVRTAKQKHQDFIGEAEIKTHYLIGDAFRLPFLDASIDCIICSEVLEHIPQYTQALEEIQRVAKDRAQVCISVPSAFPEKICWRLSNAYHSNPGGHVHIFSGKQLKNTIENFCFEHTRTHRAHALHSPYWWLRCLFWREEHQVAIVRAYHRLLVWDLMQRPRITRLLEDILNPIIGKSTVFYFKKRVSK